MNISEKQLSEIDRYLADKNKELDGHQPEWAHAAGYGEFQLAWPIIERSTGITRSQLRFRIPEGSYHFPSISLIYRSELISRLDRKPPEDCEPNPPYAGNLGLPARVCGTHLHKWSDNRQHVANSGRWELPVRRPISDHMTRLDQMFFWFCDHIGVRIQQDNRHLFLPEKSLFGGANA